MPCCATAKSMPISFKCITRTPNEEMNSIPHWLSQSNISFGTIFATVFILAAAAAIVAILNRYIRKLLDSVERHLSISYETSLTITRIGCRRRVDRRGHAHPEPLGHQHERAVDPARQRRRGDRRGLPRRLGHDQQHHGEPVPHDLAAVPPGPNRRDPAREPKGRVTGRDMMFTALREDSGATLHVPNNLFFQKMFRVSGNAEASTPAMPKARHGPTSEAAAKRLTQSAPTPCQQLGHIRTGAFALAIALLSATFASSTPALRLSFLIEGVSNGCAALRDCMLAVRDFHRS